MLCGVMNDPIPTSSSLPASVQGATAAKNTTALSGPAIADLETVAAPLLTRILSDAAGNPSSLRLAMLLGLGVVLSAWACVSLQTHVLQPLPDSIVTLLTVLIGGKLGQKFIEPKGTQLSSGLNGAQGEPATVSDSTHETQPGETAK